ncbi:hypothetical protein T265_08950 [Opisthorchis viverrini]|uniref:Uncharacterized protein n=1 Tax=Opisthorchis viverrini TaxID=6198 RepID=A0A074ZBX1_OPIVI|nr:hypothetical protein T265_08950 [Opisthorchis viverrini]KER23097.1 hypothetical protein T265_08950 [Opisthorchis viverrini]
MSDWCKVQTKGQDDFCQFIQKQLRLLLLFEHENDVVCIFQIDKAFFTGYLNTMVSETFQRSSHYFIDPEVKKERREWASLTDTALCTEAFGELFSENTKNVVCLQTSGAFLGGQAFQEEQFRTVDEIHPFGAQMGHMTQDDGHFVPDLRVFTVLAHTAP